MFHNITFQLKKKKQVPKEQNFANFMEDSPELLPAGWITEIKTRKSGRNFGAHYKCYIDPSTGSKFHSKREVFRYLKSRERDNETCEPKKKCINAPCPDNIVSQIESSPDFLPPGWVKEIRFRKKAAGGGFRKDPYYTDPVTGCIFRSKIDVLRYLETGVLGKHASGPKKRYISNMQSIDNTASPPFAAKRQKVTSARRDRSNSDGTTMKRIRGSCLGGQGSTQCSKRRQSERIRAAQLVEKQSLESEDRKQPSEMLENLVSLESRNSQHCLETDVPLKGKRSLEDVVVKLEDEKLSEDVGPSKSEGKKHADDGLLLESVDNGSLLEFQDKLPKKKPPLKSVRKISSDSGALLKSREEDQSEKGVLMESEDNIQIGSALQIQAKLEKLLDDQLVHANWVPLELEEKLLENEKEKHKAKRTTCRSGKTRSRGTSIFPRRASRRLAGLKADLAPNFEDPDRVCRLAAKQQVGREPPPSGATEECQPGEVEAEKISVVEAEELAISETKKLSTDEAKKRASEATEECQPGEVEAEKISVVEAEELAISETKKLSTDEAEKPTSEATEECQLGEVEAEKMSAVEAEEPAISETKKLSTDEAEKPTDSDKLQSPLVFPFGDSWPDPCLEFAFKTLTGDIPLDTLEVGDYFQEPLGVAHSQNPGCDELFEDEILLRPGNNSLPCFFENEMHTNDGKEKKVPREKDNTLASD